MKSLTDRGYSFAASAERETRALLVWITTQSFDRLGELSDGNIITVGAMRPFSKELVSA